MGAVSVYVEGSGLSMNDAFEKLQREAEREHGTDSYNGEINNAELCGDWTHKYTGKNLDKLYDEAIDKLGKPDVIGICIRKPKQNSNKTKSVVERTPQKGARKWVTKYVGTGWEGNPICEADTLTECIKKARSHTEKTQESVIIDIIKRLDEGNYRCAKVTYKKSKTEQLGRYVFMGWVRD